MSAVNRPPHSDGWRRARRALAAADPVLKALIAAHGACDLAPDHSQSPFEYLSAAIAYQQLHASAARAILRRHCALFGAAER
ncbi:MAG: hypothetical protein NZM12_12320, partial [Steroidobacteraceae bacterium]|nr:hypothetical protein [Steroidobacteraceae bacterium]